LAPSFSQYFLSAMIFKGSAAFIQTFIMLDVEFSSDILASDGELDLSYADFDAVA
jgi:hypothetical protein